MDAGEVTDPVLELCLRHAREQRDEITLWLAALPLAVALITVYLLWSYGPQAILYYRRKRSQPGKPGEPRS